jgi:hypothetical protein
MASLVGRPRGHQSAVLGLQDALARRRLGSATAACDVERATPSVGAWWHEPPRKVAAQLGVADVVYGIRSGASDVLLSMLRT